MLEEDWSFSDHEEHAMRSTNRFGVLVLAWLAGCAIGSRGPESPKVYESMDVAQRIDVMPDGHGTAIVLTEDGFLLTCHHVSGNGDQTLLINIAEGDNAPVAYVARVVAVDEKHDMAVVKISRRFERTAVLADISEAHPLDEVYNIGYPYGFGRLAGKGIIKAVAWHYQDEDDTALRVDNGLALDLPDGPGTSGSPIFLSRNGKLIGLMQKVVTYGPRNASGEPMSDGRQVMVRVARPVDEIRAFLDRAHIPYSTEASGKNRPSNSPPH
jgi:S1-C subfamily serine protease